MDKKIKKLLYKWKYIVYLLVAIIGVLLIFIAKEVNTEKLLHAVLLGIGCSIIATAFVTIIILGLLPNEYDEPESIHKKWGIISIHSERQNIKLSKNDLPKKQLDFIAFGLKHFREANRDDKLKKRISKGLNLRIITLHPESKYVKDQEKWENHSEIKRDILDLLNWKKMIMQELGQNARGSFEIKLYDSLPMSFYCRADDRIYTGPYVPNKHSGEAITYEFEAESIGGECFSKHFDDLWEGNKINFVNLDQKYFYGNQKESIERLLKHFCDQMKPLEGSNIIGVVVLFKKNLRRTFFSCNKRGDERHNCYEKIKGAVGQLVKLNDSPSKTCCLFRDYTNDLTFVKTDTDRYSYWEAKSLSFDRFKDDEMEAILAAPIKHNNEMIGAVTFDFAFFSDNYSKEVDRMKSLEKDTRIDDDNFLVSRWLSSSKECASIIEKMLGNEIEVQFRELYHEEWKCNE